jgi:hypothetical protein
MNYDRATVMQPRLDNDVRAAVAAIMSVRPCVAVMAVIRVSRPDHHVTAHPRTGTNTNIYPPSLSRGDAGDSREQNDERDGANQGSHGFPPRVLNRIPMEDACRQILLGNKGIRAPWMSFQEYRLSSTAPEQLDDFARLGVPAGLSLGEHELAVYFHFEHTSRGLDELHVRVGECLSDVGRQTGGPWFVVSNDAVFDRDSHGVNISGA